jgi:hypothetical protein
MQPTSKFGEMFQYSNPLAAACPSTVRAELRNAGGAAGVRSGEVAG